MIPFFVRQPNQLFIRFEGYTGQIIFSHLPILHPIIHIRVSSFHFRDLQDLLDIIVYPRNSNYYKILRALIDFNITFVDIGVDFDYYENTITPIYV